MSVPKDDVRITTLPKIADTMREASCSRRCGSDGSKGQVRRESIVMSLLSLEQQVTGVGNRVIRLNNGRETKSTVEPHQKKL